MPEVDCGALFLRRASRSDPRHEIGRDQSSSQKQDSRWVAPRSIDIDLCEVTDRPASYCDTRCKWCARRPCAHRPDTWERRSPESGRREGKHTPPNHSRIAPNTAPFSRLTPIRWNSHFGWLHRHRRAIVWNAPVEGDARRRSGDHVIKQPPAFETTISLADARRGPEAPTAGCWGRSGVSRETIRPCYTQGGGRSGGESGCLPFFCRGQISARLIRMPSLRL